MGGGNGDGATVGIPVGVQSCVAEGEGARPGIRVAEGSETPVAELGMSATLVEVAGSVVPLAGADSLLPPHLRAISTSAITNPAIMIRGATRHMERRGLPQINRFSLRIPPIMPRFLGLSS